MARKAEIFKKQSFFKATGVGASYIWKMMTRQPLIFNLNFNVTNICNQNCPMCNAVITGSPNAEAVNFETFKKYIDIFAPHKIATLSISGGEPSVVPELPDMLEYTAGKFPYGVNLNTNLYANEKIITRMAKSALRHNYRIGTSFDGLGKLADKLRGAKDVEKRVTENIKLVTKLKKELQSGSTCNMHTVISDQNLDQIIDIIKLSEKLGWTQTLAPVNNFFYQEPIDPDAPVLHYSKKLEEVIAYAATKSHIRNSRAFLLSIPKFTQGTTPKLCPYLTGLFKTNKIFLDVNGDISLCSRQAIGNINNQDVKDIFKSNAFKKDINSYRSCEGCWMICFVEILLAMPKIYQNRIIKKLNKQKHCDTIKSGNK